MFELLHRRRPQWAVIVQLEGVHVLDCGTGPMLTESWCPHRQWGTSCTGACWWHDTQVWSRLWAHLRAHWSSPRVDVHVVIDDLWLRQCRIDLPADWPSDDVEAALQLTWAQEYAQGRAWVLDHAPESHHANALGAMRTHRVDALEQTLVDAMQAGWPDSGWRLCRIQPRSLALHRGVLLRWGEAAPHCVFEIQPHVGVLSWLLGDACWVKQVWRVESGGDASRDAVLRQLRTVVQPHIKQWLTQVSTFEALRWSLVSEAAQDHWGETIAVFWADYPELQAKRCLLDGSPQAWLAWGAVGASKVRRAVA